MLEKNLPTDNVHKVSKEQPIFSMFFERMERVHSRMVDLNDCMADKLRMIMLEEVQTPETEKIAVADELPTLWTELHHRLWQMEETLNSIEDKIGRVKL